MKIQTAAVIETKNGPLAIDLWDEIEIKETQERKVGIINKKGYKFPTNDQSPSFQTTKQLLESHAKKEGVNLYFQKNIPTDSGLHSQQSNAHGVEKALYKKWDLGSPKVKALINDQYTVLVLIPKYIRTEKSWPKERIKNHFPDLQEFVSYLNENGAIEANLSGSGPAVYGLFDLDSKMEEPPKSLMRKIKFLWSGKSCATNFKLID